MTSPQMSIVKVDGTEARVRTFMKDVGNRAAKVVRDGSAVYVVIPAQELSWLDKIARDAGVKKLEVQELPAHQKAPCGVFTTQLRFHIAGCKSCAALRPRKPHDGEARTVIRVEGLHDLSLSGLLPLMKQRMDEAMALAQEWDTAIKAVEKIPLLQSQMGTLNRQIEEHRQALKYFTERR